MPLPARKPAGGRSFEPVMIFTGDGLILGHIVLAPFRQTRARLPGIALGSAEERTLA